MKAYLPFLSPLSIRLGGAASCLAFATLLAGCSDSANDDAGEAPVLTSVSISQSTLSVGKSETLSGEFLFEDPDGDLAQFSLTISIGGQSATTQKTAIQNVAGQTSGKGIFAAALIAPSAGPLEIALTIFDAAGHASSPKSVTLTAK